MISKYIFIQLKQIFIRSEMFSFKQNIFLLYESFVQYFFGEQSSLSFVFTKLRILISVCKLSNSIRV